VGLEEKRTMADLLKDARFKYFLGDEKLKKGILGR